MNMPVSQLLAVTRSVLCRMVRISCPAEQQTYCECAYLAHLVVPCIALGGEIINPVLLVNRVPRLLIALVFSWPPYSARHIQGVHNNG